MTIAEGRERESPPPSAFRWERRGQAHENGAVLADRASSPIWQLHPGSSVVHSSVFFVHIFHPHGVLALPFIQGGVGRGATKSPTCPRGWEFMYFGARRVINGAQFWLFLLHIGAL